MLTTSSRPPVRSSSLPTTEDSGALRSAASSAGEIVEPPRQARPYMYSEGAVPEGFGSLCGLNCIRCVDVSLQVGDHLTECLSGFPIVHAVAV